MWWPLCQIRTPQTRWTFRHQTPSLPSRRAYGRRLVMHVGRQRASSPSTSCRRRLQDRATPCTIQGQIAVQSETRWRSFQSQVRCARMKQNRSARYRWQQRKNEHKGQKGQHGQRTCNDDTGAVAFGDCNAVRLGTAGDPVGIDVVASVGVFPHFGPRFTPTTTHRRTQLPQRRVEQK